MARAFDSRACRERFVDVGPLFELVARRARLADALRAGQIDQVDGGAHLNADACTSSRQRNARTRTQPTDSRSTTDRPTARAGRHTSFCWPPTSSFCCILMMKIECERDDVAFMFVDATCGALRGSWSVERAPARDARRRRTARMSFPWSISMAIFSPLSAAISCSPCTYTPSTCTRARAGHHDRLRARGGRGERRLATGWHAPGAP